MKKKFKILAVIVAVIVVAYVAFAGFEAIRLSSPENKGAKPVITIGEAYSESSIKYVGLGYTVTYKLSSSNGLDDGSVTTHYIYSAEVRLFDKVLLGAWIE